MGRFNIYRLAMRLHVTPEEIEEMDAEWYQDILLFMHTEELVARIRGK